MRIACETKSARAVLEAQLEERQAILQRAPLSRRARAKLVAPGIADYRHPNELLAVTKHLLVRGCSFLDVRLNEDLTARRQYARRFLREPIADDQALLVALLPPRIRKVHVDPL